MCKYTAFYLAKRATDLERKIFLVSHYLRRIGINACARSANTYGFLTHLVHKIRLVSPLNTIHDLQQYSAVLSKVVRM